MRLAIAAGLLAAGAAACEGRSTSAPWLTYPGISGHSAYLPLAGTPHDPSAAGTAVSCEGCHPGSTFTQFACTGCHAQGACDAIHLGVVAGYTWSSDTCYACHRQGIAAPANHNSDYFPVGSGTRHQGISCRQCHTDMSRPNDPAAFACASCHLATAGLAALHTSPASGVAILTVHTSETQTTAPLALTSQNCLRCHADGQVDRIAAHPGGEEGLGNRDHRPAGCTTCHSGYRTDKPFGANFGAGSGCRTCH